MDLATSDQEPKIDEKTTDVEPDSIGKLAENPANEPPEPDEWDLLAEHDIGTEVMIKRTSPDYAAGWLPSVNLDGSGASGVMEKIRATHGGGVFNLQPRARSKNGRRLFSKGTIRVEICGMPIVDGRRWGPNGPIVEPSPQPVMPHPGAYPYPPPAPQPDTGLQSELMALVGQAIKKGDATVDVAGVISALTQLGVTAHPVATAAPIDPYDSVKKSLELQQMLQQMNPAPAPTQSEDRLGKLLEVMAMKWMMGGDSAPFGGGRQTRKPPARQQVRNARASGPPTPQPSPNHVWHPERGWVVWGGEVRPQRDASAEPSANASSAAGGDVSPREESNDRPTNEPSDDYIPPIVPEELIGELEAKTPEERKQFARDMMAGISENPELQDAFMSAMAELHESTAAE